MGKKYQQLLRNLLTQENDPIVRAKIMEQLEIQAGPSGTEAVQDQTPAVLIKALEDPIGEIRQAACVALGTLASKEAIPALIERLGDADPRVRAAAKEALASLGESSLIQFFRQDLDETNPVLRSSSFIALARLNSIEVVPVLIQAAVDPETPTLVRVQAVRALGIIKPYVARVVNNGLVLTNLQQTLVADKNLGIGYQSNGKALVTVFIEALRNPSSPLHADAPFVLKEFADPASLPALREILRQGAGDVALSSLYALGELRDKDAVEDILAFCKRF
jgi:HEAT repeat protein